ncbi:MAG: hypothetical protein ACKO24_19590 [Leptolyngbyaceae cyanobacterium]
MLGKIALRGWETITPDWLSIGTILLDLAGFYEPPFRVDGETNIQVSAEDEGETIQGCIDVLVIQRAFLPPAIF